MDDICKSAFDEFSDSVRIIYAPCRWRAFQIHLGTSAMPGVVCLLSSILAEASISILNVSTYDADFILVQEADVVKATGMIRDSLKRGLHGLFEQQQSLTLATAATAPGQVRLLNKIYFNFPRRAARRRTGMTWEGERIGRGFNYCLYIVHILLLINPLKNLADLTLPFRNRVLHI
ncbi:hypothetical protein T492DRAFT_164714 [Pavlovales sp. CCMP2436]|nr:hypothetical protein T492DRAFT_164714 [Pavlovales sp. CCMP2436]